MYARIKLPNTAPKVIKIACKPMVAIFETIVLFKPTPIPKRNNNIYIMRVVALFENRMNLVSFLRTYPRMKPIVINSNTGIIII